MAKFVTSQYKADRSTLAQYTTDEKYLDILVTDEDPLVRAVVAEKGIEKYLDILINDDSNVVLNHVIATGNQKYIDEIIKKIFSKKIHTCVLILPVLVLINTVKC